MDVESVIRNWLGDSEWECHLSGNREQACRDPGTFLGSPEGRALSASLGDQLDTRNTETKHHGLYQIGAFYLWITIAAQRGKRITII